MGRAHHLRGESGLPLELGASAEPKWFVQDPSSTVELSSWRLNAFSGIAARAGEENVHYSDMSLIVLPSS